MQTVSRRSGRAAFWAARFCLAILVMSLAVGMSVGAVEAGMKRESIVLLTDAGERSIEIEVAQSPEDMALGLMFRTQLPDGQGMLFPSSAPRESSMWMRNTFIALDMVFIRADGVIHRIEAMTEPMSEAIIASNGPVLAVLELAGGAAQRLGLKVGDGVRHPMFAGKRDGTP
jgi:uncharacterized protein